MKISSTPKKPKKKGGREGRREREGDGERGSMYGGKKYQNKEPKIFFGGYVVLTGESKCYHKYYKRRRRKKRFNEYCGARELVCLPTTTTFLIHHDLKSELFNKKLPK